MSSSDHTHLIAQRPVPAPISHLKDSLCPSQPSRNRRCTCRHRRTALTRKAGKSSFGSCSLFSSKFSALENFVKDKTETQQYSPVTGKELTNFSEILDSFWDGRPVHVGTIFVFLTNLPRSLPVSTQGFKVSREPSPTFSLPPDFPQHKPSHPAWSP